jgi:hypothetical protein
MYVPSSSQGTFTSDGSVKTLNIPANFDWIRVKNLTAASQTAADLNYEFFWQKGMTNGLKWTILGTVANDPITVAEITANEGFLLVDSSTSPLGGAVVITSSTDATEPVFSTGTTTNLSTGTIVRILDMTDQENLSGYDFAIDNVNPTPGDFKMAAPLATAPGAAGGAGVYRIVNWDPLFYPRWRYIANITRASSAVITLTVPSGYFVGQKVTVIVPTTEEASVSDYGMVEINNLVGIVTAVDDTVGTQTITVDIDSSAFTAFTFPTAAKAAIALQKAIVVPAGYDAATAIAESVSIQSFPYRNTGFFGVRLLNPNTTGLIAGPAGADGDEIFWQCGNVTVNQ